MGSSLTPDPRPLTPNHRERGSSAVEFVLMLPFVTTVFLILVGLGYTLPLKQQSLVAARYSTTYDVAMANQPDATAVSHAASKGMQTFTMTRTTAFAQQPETNGAGSGSAITDIFMGVLDDLVQASGQVDYTTGTTVTRGIIPQLYPNIPAARAHYSLPGQTWTCAQMNGSSYLTFILNQGGVGDVLGTNGEECCQCYTGS